MKKEYDIRHIDDELFQTFGFGKIESCDGEAVYVYFPKVDKTIRMDRDDYKVDCDYYEDLKDNQQNQLRKLLRSMNTEDIVEIFKEEMNRRIDN